MEQKKNFLRGALIGALAMFIIGIVVGGAVVAFALSGSDNDIVASETKQILQEIRKYIDRNYLYSDEIDQ